MSLDKLPINAFDSSFVESSSLGSFVAASKVCPRSF
jgi:hypothetical protein